MEEREIEGKVYRLVYLRGRGKWISIDGEAYNPIKFNQPATIHINRDGYPCFGGGIPVHLYVAHAWLGGWFEGAEVDHINYDRTDYSVSNLRWVTHEENIKHSTVDSNRHIGARAGYKNGRAKLNQSQVDTVKKLFDEGYKTYEVVRIMHPEASNAERKRLWNRYNRIKTGETWTVDLKNVC